MRRGLSAFVCDAAALHYVYVCWQRYLSCILRCLLSRRRLMSRLSSPLTSPYRHPVDHPMSLYHYYYSRTSSHRTRSRSLSPTCRPCDGLTTRSPPTSTPATTPASSGTSGGMPHKDASRALRVSSRGGCGAPGTAVSYCAIHTRFVQICEQFSDFALRFGGMAGQISRFRGGLAAQERGEAGCVIQGGVRGKEARDGLGDFQGQAWSSARVPCYSTCGLCVYRLSTMCT